MLKRINDIPAGVPAAAMAFFLLLDLIPHPAEEFGGDSSKIFSHCVRFGTVLQKSEHANGFIGMLRNVYVFTGASFHIYCKIQNLFLR